MSTGPYPSWPIRNSTGDPADHDRFDQPGTERSRCPGPQGLSRNYERNLFRCSGRVFARWTMRSWPTGHRGARSTESLGPARLPESVWNSRGPRISGRPHMHFPYSGRLGIIDQRYVSGRSQRGRIGKVCPVRARSTPRCAPPVAMRHRQRLACRLNSARYGLVVRHRDHQLIGARSWSSRLRRQWRAARDRLAQGRLCQQPGPRLPADESFPSAEGTGLVVLCAMRIVRSSPALAGRRGGALPKVRGGRRVDLLDVADEAQ